MDRFIDSLTKDELHEWVAVAILEGWYPFPPKKKPTIQSRLQTKTEEYYAALGD